MADSWLQPVFGEAGTFPSWGTLFLEQFAAGLIPFLLVAGLLFLAFYVILPRLLLHRKVQAAFPASTEIRREILLSIQAIAIFACAGVLMVELYRLGWTRLYLRVDERGWPYFFFSIVLLIFLQDAWFYWTHRFLHWPPVYRRVHSLHHKSHNPTPWAAFALHPVEALIEALIFPLAVVLIPIHVWSEGIWFLYMVVISAYVHLGFETMPRGFVRHWFTRWHITEMHHNLHHSHYRGNYGLYFTLWDSLMGTNHKEYEQRFDAVTSAPKMSSREAKRKMRSQKMPHEKARAA